MKLKKWLFGQSMSARCTRSALLTAIPIVTVGNALSLDVDAYKTAALAGASAFLTVFAVMLTEAD